MILRKIFLLSIRFYQAAVSPHFPPCCRFYPSCSVYAYQAVERFGVFKGGSLALLRLLRCHPLNKGGFDPIPEYYEKIRCKIYKYNK